MSRSALRSSLKCPLCYFVLGALCCVLAVGCGGHGIDLGNSCGGGSNAGAYTAGGAADAPSAGSPSAGAFDACTGLSCVTPCSYTSDYANGGATGVLFCDLQGECVSALPQCHGDSGGAGGAAAGAGGAAAGAGGIADNAGGSFGGGSAAGGAASAGSGGI